ncbi:TonB-dependent siderophore receptor [Xanthomonas axonopodis pv. poinsettiicola]|uniref:TonB-dependent siderophore receptor n=1 Tax=Xanthomonas TaxID=338 RepID=UPI001E593FF9|nr:TonB-dependent siderophore receptor [Xanthomonas codiaei]MCC8536478.1 TonB-dependent siderophore receptor [Xanthomonas codiaei]
MAESIPDAQDLDAVQVRGVRGTSYAAPRANTATRTDAAILDVAQSIQVVTAAMLDDQRVRTLDDALVNVSGVMRAPNRAGTQDAFLRRGFGDSSNGSILRDGVRSMQNRNFSATTEQVEVLKGPASSLYGIQQPGGVINVISKQPQQLEHTQLQLNSTSVGGGGMMVDTTGPIGQSGFSYRAIASYDDVDHWRTFGTQRRRLVAPSLAWRNASTEVVLAVERTDYSMPFDDGTFFVDGKPLAIPRDRSLVEPFSKMDGKTDFATLRMRHVLSKDWTLRATAAYNRNRYDDVRARSDGYDSDTGLLRRRFDGREGVDDLSRYIVADALGHFNSQYVSHELLVGVDHENTDNHTDGELARLRIGGFDVWNPTYGTVAMPTEVDPDTRNLNSNLTSSSVFMQDAVSLGERWVLSAALRYQRWEQKEGGGSDYVVTQDIDGGELLPRLGLVYKLGTVASLYANYATSFVPNLSSNPAEGAFDPEKGRVHEIGAKVDLGERLAATLALYNINKRNVVISLDDDTARAVGQAQSRGVELDIAGRITPWLDVVGAYAYTATEILEDTPETEGNMMPNIARHQASLSLVARPQWTTGPVRWQVGGGTRYVGPRQGDEANSFELPSYVVVDASIGATLVMAGSRTASLDLGLRNVFDRTYYPFADGETRVMVGEPRRFEARLRIDL